MNEFVYLSFHLTYLFNASFGIVVFCLHCLLSCLLTYTILRLAKKKGDNLTRIWVTCLFKLFHLVTFLRVKMIQYYMKDRKETYLK